METTPGSECGELIGQYGSYVDFWSGNCYWLMRHGNYLNREECSEACNDVGGHLCSIHSDQEERFVIDLIRKHSARKTWLGGTGWDIGSDWQWDDGTEWNYWNWRAGQPNPLGDEDTCLYTEANGIPNDHDGGWIDGDCHYITEDWNCMCKITTTSDPKSNPTTEVTVPTKTTTTTQLVKMETSPGSECGEGWQYGSDVDVWSGNCYWLMRHGNYINREDCRQACNDVNGHLCSIHSEEEERVVIDLIRKHSARNTWLGATGWDSGSDWMWDDGTNWNYENWRQGQPNPHDNETTCLFTEANGIPNDHDGGWLDGDCHYITQDWNCMCKKTL